MIKISEKRLKHLKNNFKGKRIAVIGDMMLDIYFWGDVKRISPEAPVPVLEVENEFYRFGGAANVALNISSLNGIAEPIGIIGYDNYGTIFNALNSDLSIRSIKGDKRPILKQDERAFIVSNLKPVDYVTFFNEDTPAEIISELVPDVLVKGGDWAIEKIVGREIVEVNGGEVKTINFVNDQSTSNIIKIIKERYKD